MAVKPLSYFLNLTQYSIRSTRLVLESHVIDEIALCFVVVVVFFTLDYGVITRVRVRVRVRVTSTTSQMDGSRLWRTVPVMIRVQQQGMVFPDAVAPLLYY